MRWGWGWGWLALGMAVAAQAQTTSWPGATYEYVEPPGKVSKEDFARVAREVQALQEWLGPNGVNIGGQGGGTVVGPGTSTDRGLVLFDGTTGQLIQAAPFNEACVVGDEYDCCTGPGAGTCVVAVDAMGLLFAQGFDTPARRGLAGCTNMKEAAENAPGGGAPNVMQLCAPLALAADRRITFLASGNVSAADVENPAGTTNVCARFATDGEGNTVLVAAAEDCQLPSNTPLAFEPAVRAEFYDEFLTGISGTGSGVGLGWSTFDDTGASTNCAGSGIGNPVANHPGVYKVSTSASAGTGCQIRNAAGTGATWGTDLTARTNWSMEFSFTRGSPVTNAIYVWGLSVGGTLGHPIATAIPDKFLGVVVRDNTADAAVPYCKGAGQPFACCTANNAGAGCDDTAYVVVACDGANNQGPCTEVVTGAAPSAANTWDRIRFDLSAPGTFRVSIFNGDGDESPDVTTVSTNIPSMTPKMKLGVGTLDTTPKTLNVDFFRYVDTGVDR